MSSRIRASAPLPDPFAEQPKPIPPAPRPLPPTELDQVCRLPARSVPSLPSWLVLACRHPFSSRGFWVATSRRHYEVARAAHWPVMNGDDWLDCVRTAEQGASVLAIERWLIPRQPPPPPDSWPLGTLQALLGPPRDELELLGSPSVRAELTVGEVLDHFRCELVGVDPPLDAFERERAARLL